MSGGLVALHGYTQSGAVLEAALRPLLGERQAVFPDAPFAAATGARTWWRASDDGRVYEGWERTRDLLAGLLEAAGPDPVLFGFSQGAMVAACAAAWSLRGELPALARVVLVAGMPPRAEALQPLFAAPLAVRSLHVVGARDPMAAAGPLLAARFVDPEVLTWDGPHVVPTRGPASVRLGAFLAGDG